MTHLSENSRRLAIQHIVVKDSPTPGRFLALNDVCLLVLPEHSLTDRSEPTPGLDSLLKELLPYLGPQATLITLGDPVDLAHVHAAVSPLLNYQLWGAIKRKTPGAVEDRTALPEEHFGALVHTRYSGALRHTRTRIQYTYCPACDKTTKDYGGKKHTYNSYGTLLSDIWRDIEADLTGDLSPVIERFADLFGLEAYREMVVLDCRSRFAAGAVEEAPLAQPKPPYVTATMWQEPELAAIAAQSRLLQGDCLENLRLLPENSVDFAFIDPPYNLGKNYNNYADDLSIQEYFTWCDAWMAEIARVLKPGRTLAVLNIPLWAIRHFLYLVSCQA